MERWRAAQGVACQSRAARLLRSLRASSLWDLSPAALAAAEGPGPGTAAGDRACLAFLRCQHPPVRLLRGLPRSSLLSPSSSSSSNSSSCAKRMLSDPQQRRAKEATCLRCVAAAAGAGHGRRPLPTSRGLGGPFVLLLGFLRRNGGVWCDDEPWRQLRSVYGTALLVDTQTVEAPTSNSRLLGAGCLLLHQVLMSGQGSQPRASAQEQCSRTRKKPR